MFRGAVFFRTRCRVLRRELFRETLSWFQHAAGVEDLELRPPLVRIIWPCSVVMPTEFHSSRLKYRPIDNYFNLLGPSDKITGGLGHRNVSYRCSGVGLVDVCHVRADEEIYGKYIIESSSGHRKGWEIGSLKNWTFRRTSQSLEATSTTTWGWALNANKRSFVAGYNNAVL